VTNELKNIQAQIAALNAGIVPFGRWGEEGAPHHDFTRILKNMDPDESRRMRRNFRKAWRKLAKAKESSSNRWIRNEVKAMGLHCQRPDRKMKNTRKYLVAYDLTQEKNPF